MKLALLVTGCTLALGIQAGFAEEAATFACNAALIRGTYSATTSGWQNATPPYTPLVGEQTFAFDGVKKATATGYHAIGGAAAVVFSVVGTYKVNPDCTYSLTGTITSSGGGMDDQFGVVADNGNHIHAIRTDASHVLTVEYERISQ
jgi:hypothetical protein